jgi:hypothetical protein
MVRETLAMLWPGVLFLDGQVDVISSIWGDEMAFDSEYDSRPLMRQLAAMAQIPESRARRMVLVLDVDDAPKLYVEQFLDRNVETVLVDTPLVVAHGRVDVTMDGGVTVDTTSMQNREYRTCEP